MLRPISRILSREEVSHSAWMIISLGFELPRTSSDLPEDLDRASLFARLARNPASVFLFGLAPGDAYRANDVTITAVGSYSTVSPLPEPQRPDGISSPLGHRRFDFCGAGVGLLRLGVTQRPALGVRTFLPMSETSSDHPVFTPAQT